MDWVPLSPCLPLSLRRQLRWPSRHPSSERASLLLTSDSLAGQLTFWKRVILVVLPLRVSQRTRYSVTLWAYPLTQ